MKQKIHAIATALAFWKLKAKGEKLKAVGKFSQKQFTRGLPQPAPHKADASGFAMTGEGRALVSNRGNQTSKAVTQSHATGSLALWVEGSFYLDLFRLFIFFQRLLCIRSAQVLVPFSSRKIALAILSAIEKQSKTLRKKKLALVPAMRDGKVEGKGKNEDFQSEEPNSNKYWLQIYCGGNITVMAQGFSGISQLRQMQLLKQEAEGERLKAMAEPSQTQLTRGLPQPASHKADALGFAMTGRRKGIVSKLRPNLLMLLLMLVVMIEGNQAKSQTKPLQIGDTIPEALWNTPMEVLNHPEGKSSIRLSDYKGKLIILDFWATWCVNCVKSFPEEGRLQKEFQNDIVILPVTKQKQAIITAFMQRNNPTKGTHLTVVTDDQILSEIFKHQLMPHVVWIDGAGRLVASTAASYVQAEKIEQVLKGEQLHWTMKRDFMEFDKRHALMGWVDRGGAEPKTIGYSAFTSHLSGVDPVAGLQSKQEEGSQRRYDINMTLGTFSVRAFEGALPVLSKKQYLYKVKDINNYSCPPGTLYMDWKVQHTFCYEAVMPASFNQSQIKQKMREDLKSYFGLEGKLEYRKVSAWVFHQIATSAKPNRSQDGQTLGNLIWEINERHPELPLATAERSIEDLIVPKMNGKIDSLPALNKALTAYGITIKAEESEQPFFVLYELQPNH